MNIFLLGGWVARPSASLFLRLRWFLVFGVYLVALLFVVALLDPMLNLTALCLLSLSLLPCLSLVCLAFPHCLVRIE